MNINNTFKPKQSSIRHVYFIMLRKCLIMVLLQLSLHYLITNKIPWPADLT